MHGTGVKIIDVQHAKIYNPAEMFIIAPHSTAVLFYPVNTFYNIGHKP